MIYVKVAFLFLRAIYTYSLRAKGSENVSKQKLAEIRELALKAQAYEQEKYRIEPPQTLVGMIERLDTKLNG